MLTTKEKKYSNAHKTKKIDKKGNIAFLKFDKQTWLQFKDMMTGSNDAEINNTEIHNKLIKKTKHLLGFEGLTHPNGDHELGLDIARYINPFPGTAGDFRIWIGGIRPLKDIIAVLENLEYAYQRAKIVILEEELEKKGIKSNISDIVFKDDQIMIRYVNNQFLEKIRKDFLNNYRNLLHNFLKLSFASSISPRF